MSPPVKIRDIVFAVWNIIIKALSKYLNFVSLAFFPIISVSFNLRISVDILSMAKTSSTPVMMLLVFIYHHISFYNLTH